MRTNSSNAPGWWAAALYPLSTQSQRDCRGKRGPSMIVQGIVFLIDRDSSTIMVDTKTGLRRLVVYSSETKFRYGRNDKGQESSIGQVQKTQYIACIGKSDDGARLVAKECVHRWEK